ncbi:DUF6650 family protein [Mobilicoccus caccae]|uniref:Uncharacterized protein n=1 Tax=Mobilicoccus caccae TaxID=1859295 RepID=A0ABQ6ISG9_9MICO|nr:DUF6650 family protein [Mobilicoccus caccae]GMA40857.1 hypothetical protein GCM10025883_29020 [Mobilicoccus caccae]
MRRRLTGVSVPMGGLQWEAKDDDREIARRAMNLFEDRRMLWKDFSLEVEEDCVRSASEVRRALGVLIDSPDIKPDLVRQLKVCQAAFREFMDSLGGEDPRGGWRHAYGTDPLSMALGRLRALIGVQVGEFREKYGLEVSPDLASIVPDESGWFFEEFGREGRAGE